MDDAVAAALPLVDSRSDQSMLGQWLRVWGVHVEVILALSIGLAVAAATPVDPAVSLGALALWLVGAFYRGRAVTTPLAHQLRTVVRSTALPLAALAIGVGVFGRSPEAMPYAIGAIGAAATTTLVARSLRWSLQVPVRVIAVGDRASIATAITRLARTPHTRVVGGLVAEEGLNDDAVPHEILGIPTHAGIGDVAAHTRSYRADLVVVDPGRSVSADDFRRLTWALEGHRVSIGVTGVLKSVAPHRVTPGTLGRSAILDVRPPRQSNYMRMLKSGVDRGIGGLLLALVSPVLLAMIVAVRLDSPGPALFTQTRVGRGGKHFTVFKMRTMVRDAEAIKSTIASTNEFDSVLFKVRRDPRITRLGSFLRTTSLDELPQLINVVKGEMSLVGPRPHLPEEVELMDEDTQRRHAVQPGITGLWQVSGRSDLSWDEASALDTYYADNWNLAGDLSIAMRTVKAVAGRKGAY